MLSKNLWLSLLAAMVVGNGAIADDAGYFPDEVDRTSVQQQTASYSCLAQCTVRYIHTRTGATSSKASPVAVQSRKSSRRKSASKVKSFGGAGASEA